MVDDAEVILVETGVDDVMLLADAAVALAMRFDEVELTTGRTRGLMFW